VNTRIALLVGLLVLIVITIWSGISFFARQDQKDLSAKWDEQFDSFEEFEKRFPPQSANHSALELEKLTAEMGIKLTPK
jgi:hypothetical protein